MVAAFHLALPVTAAVCLMLRTRNRLKSGKFSSRLARCLWELSKSGKIHIDEIYRQMAFGNQTDKEFAINGQTWRRYVTSKRILHPIMPKTALQEIIAPGFIEHLRPERRFDQTLYFTMRN